MDLYNCLPEFIHEPAIGHFFAKRGSLRGEFVGTRIAKDLTQLPASQDCRELLIYTNTLVTVSMRSRMALLEALWDCPGLTIGQRVEVAIVGGNWAVKTL